jgi:hypothetical protein
MLPTIDIYSLAAKPVEMRFGDTLVGRGTAFTWATADQAFLVTNWHVISGINPITGKHLHKESAEPDHLVVEFDLRDPMGSRGPLRLPLYGGDGDPLWLEHPLAKGIDVVALQLPPLPGAHPHPINMMPTTPMAVGIGQDAFIIGYPFGLRTGQFPIWKRASIASELEVHIRDQHFFFVDSASREGMSGAPVIARTAGHFVAMNGDSVLSPGPHNRFLGVYAGRIGADDEQKVQLGRVWHAELIEQIIAGNRRGSHPWAYSQT